MANTISISCPKCGKKSNAPTSVVGKKVKCKNCETVFPVKPPKSSVAAAPEAEEKIKLDFSDIEAVDEEDEDGPARSYGVTEGEEGIPRCPHCAGELEEADQVICLHCGYNLRTRAKAEVKTVYENTGSDVFMWLLPGIGCVVAIITLIVVDILCYVNRETWMDFMKAEDGTWYVKPGILPFYVSLFSLMFIIPLGKFAWKRLVVNNKPPEKIKLH